MDGVLNTTQAGPTLLEALASVARDGAEAAIARSLAAARELLGMELAYVAEADGDSFRFRALDGETEPFGGPEPGAVIPRCDTLCDRMLGGAIPHVVPDVEAEPAARTATGSVGVGAYVGVPVRLVDGTVYGSLCCVSTHAAPALRERDARLLRCWRG